MIILSCNITLTSTVDLVLLNSVQKRITTTFIWSSYNRVCLLYSFEATKCACPRNCRQRSKCVRSCRVTSVDQEIQCINMTSGVEQTDSVTLAGNWFSWKKWAGQYCENTQGHNCNQSFEDRNDLLITLKTEVPIVFKTLQLHYRDNSVSAAWGNKTHYYENNRNTRLLSAYGRWSVFCIKARV
jgi:hypothetical protein